MIALYHLKIAQQCEAVSDSKKVTGISNAQLLMPPPQCCSSMNDFQIRHGPSRPSSSASLTLPFSSRIKTLHRPCWCFVACLLKMLQSSKFFLLCCPSCLYLKFMLQCI